MHKIIIIIVIIIIIMIIIITTIIIIMISLPNIIQCIAFYFFLFLGEGEVLYDTLHLYFTKTFIVLAFFYSLFVTWYTSLVHVCVFLHTCTRVSCGLIYRSREVRGNFGVNFWVNILFYVLLHEF